MAWGVVVAAHFVRKARVRIAENRDIRVAGQFFDVGPQFGGSQGAVDPHTVQVPVADGRPAGLHGLARQCAAAGVDDAERSHQWNTSRSVVEEAVDGEQRRLQVERVDLGLDQEQVHAAVEESAGLLPIGGREVVEGHGPEGRITDVGGDGCRTGRGPHGAGDEARPLRIVGHGGRGGTLRDPRRSHVDVVYPVLHAVVGLRDRGGVEGVGLDDIGAGVQVLAVDLLDQFGLCDRQQVEIAPQSYGVVFERIAAVIGFFEGMALQDRAHGAVDDEDSFGKQPVQLAVGVRRNERGLAEDCILLHGVELRGCPRHGRTSVPGYGRPSLPVHGRSCLPRNARRVRMSVCRTAVTPPLTFLL